MKLVNMYKNLNKPWLYKIIMMIIINLEGITRGRYWTPM